MRSRIVLGVVGLTALTISAVEASAQVASHASGTPEAHRVAATKAAQPGGLDDFSLRANSVQEALAEVGATDPDFATVVIDHKNETVAVYRVGGEATSAYASVNTQGIHLAFRPAKLTQQQSHDLLTSIGTAGSALTSRGAVVSGTSTDYTGNVTVTLVSDTPAAETAVRDFAPTAEATDLTFQEGVVARHF